MLRSLSEKRNRAFDPSTDRHPSWRLEMACHPSERSLIQLLSTSANFGAAKSCASPSVGLCPSSCSERYPN